MSKVSSVVLCDDVRREISGKDILIGAYAGTIVVASIPFALRVALWVEIEATETGVLEIHLRITLDGKKPSDLKIALLIDRPATIAAPITNLNLNGDVEGKLQIEWSLDKIRWETVKTYEVVRGTVTGLPQPQPQPQPQPSPVPAAPSTPRA